MEQLQSMKQYYKKKLHSFIDVNIVALGPSQRGVKGQEAKNMWLQLHSFSDDDIDSLKLIVLQKKIYIQKYAIIFACKNICNIYQNKFKYVCFYILYLINSIRFH